MVGHRQGEKRQRQSDPDPETASHVAKLGIGMVFYGRHQRLERHAADRTRARLRADDLRMHRAGPQHLPGCRPRRDRDGGQS